MEVLVDSLYYLNDVSIDIEELGGYHEYYFHNISLRDSFVTWIGKSYEDDIGFLVLIQKGDLFGGFIIEDFNLWQLMPLGNNKIFALKYKPEYDGLFDCALTGDIEPPDDDSIPDPCQIPLDDCHALIRVLIEVTPKAQEWLDLIYGTDSNAQWMFYKSMEEQVNLAINNSGILNKRFEITTYMSFDFDFNYTENNVPIIDDDIEDLSNSSELFSDLIDYGCDITVMLTDQNYFTPSGKIYGIVNEIGPPDGFCAIVEADQALNSGFTFAHEVAHILGGRHNRSDDNTDICNHAWIISSPDTNLAFTIVSRRYDSTNLVILNYSNPFVRVYGQRTGNGANFNAAAIANNGCYIAEYESDPYWSIDIIGPDSVCVTEDDTLMFIATVNEPSPVNFGQPPYKYIWQHGFVYDSAHFPNLNWLWATDEGDTLLVPYTPDEDHLVLFVRLIVTSDDDYSIWIVKEIKLFPDGCEPDPHVPIVWKPRTIIDSIYESMPCGHLPIIVNTVVYDELKINTSNSTDDPGNVHLIIFDMAGKCIQRLYKIESSFNFSILNLDHLAPGMYFVSVINSCDKLVYKFLKI
jgi:hypothetical protein